MRDLLVIGGGLAGATAALVARAAGRQVALCSRSWGATALSTGALDIAFSPALAPDPAQQVSRSLLDHLQDIVAHRPRHPYGILGLPLAREALGRGHAAVAAALAAQGLPLPALDLAAQNVGLASSLGALVPAAGGLGPHGGADLSGPGPFGLLALAGDAYCAMDRVARGLAHDARRLYGRAPQFEPLPVGIPAAAPIEMARRLDDPAAADALAAQLRGRGAGMVALLAPPCLGLARHAEVRARLSEAAAAPVVEVLAHLPSVPGVRLSLALAAALRAAGVELLGEVTGASCRDGRVHSVATAADGAVQAAAYVLATGRFVAGGMRWDERCCEALFGLPAVTEVGPMEDVSPHGVVRERPMESHPLMTAGIKVNRQMQPVAEGRVACANLFAAGMVLGGFASRYSLCADGVALATGAQAAREACPP